MARLRLPVLLALHGLIFAACGLSAYALRFDGAIPGPVWAAAWAALPLLVSAKLASFLLLGCWRGGWRSAGFADLARLAEAVTLGSLAVVLVGLGSGTWPVPLSVLVID